MGGQHVRWHRPRPLQVQGARFRYGFCCVRGSPVGVMLRLPTPPLVPSTRLTMSSATALMTPHNTEGDVEPTHSTTGATDSSALCPDGIETVRFPL
jgi:hypothetical protein